MVFKAVTFVIAMIVTSSICQAQSEAEKKVVFVLIDGISADVIEKVSTPNLDAISQEGGYTRAYMGGEKGGYSQTPTISAVGYNSLLTGTWANKHNVWGNDIKSPNYHHWNVFRIAKQMKPKIRTAIFSSWEDNRTKLIGEGMKEAGGFEFDYSYDGYELDTVNFPHDKDEHYISKVDEMVSKRAAECIAKEGPDLSWMYLWYTDTMGHKFGDSEAFYRSIELADKQVGRVWDAVKQRKEKFNEDWMIVITTDHGRRLPDGKGHGGQSDRERSIWIVTNHQNTNSYFKSNPAIVDIAPSILRHMEIEMPEDLNKEMDGISLIGGVSASDLKARKKGSQFNLTWKSFGEGAPATVYISETNHFKSGGTDRYTKVLSVNSFDERASFEIKGSNLPFYKIVLVTADNTLNTWVVEKQEEAQ